MCVIALVFLDDHLRFFGPLLQEDAVVWYCYTSTSLQNVLAYAELEMILSVKYLITID